MLPFSSPWLIFLEGDWEAVTSGIEKGLTAIAGKSIAFVSLLKSPSEIKKARSKLATWQEQWRNLNCKFYFISDADLDRALIDSLLWRLLAYNKPSELFLPQNPHFSVRQIKVYQNILHCLAKQNYSGHIFLYEQSVHEWLGDALQREQQPEHLFLQIAKFSSYQIALSSEDLAKKVGIRCNHLSDPSNPLVSIVMRTRNRPDLLKQAAESVIQQDYPNIELVVVNDGGESVADCLDNAREQLSNVQYLHLVQNQGRATAANTGLDYASGEYIQFLDDDDLIDSHHISQLMHALQQNGQYQAAYAGIRLENQNYDFNYDFNPHILKAWNYIPIHAVLFSSRLLQQGCRFDARLEAFEDWDFWIQMSQFTDFYHLSEFGGDYRQTGNSDGGTFQTTEKTDFYRLCVIDKWQQKLSSEELEKIFYALKEYPSSNEEQLTIKHTLLQQQKLLVEEQLSNKIDHINALNEVSEGQKKSIETLNEELQKQQYARQQLSDQLIEANEKNKQLNQAQQQLKSAQAVLENQKQQLQNHLSQVLNSSSWKITRPVRYIGRKLKSLIRALRRTTHLMELNPSPQLEKRDNHTWYSQATDPRFVLKSDQGRMPTGWVRITARLEVAEQEESILFYALDQQGFVARQMTFLDNVDGQLDSLVYLPDNTTALRIDPIYGAGEFRFENLQFLELGRFRLLGFLAGVHWKRWLGGSHRGAEQLKGLIKALKKSGLRGMTDWLMMPYTNNYARWIKMNDQLAVSDREKIYEQLSSINQSLSFSVVIDLMSSTDKDLNLSIQSVQKQLYPHWHLIILVSGEFSTSVSQSLSRDFPDLDYLLVSYTKEQQISRYNQVLDRVKGEFLGIIPAGVQLSERALYYAALSVREQPQVKWLYADDDRLNSDQQRIEPDFKSDWDPLFFRGYNYVGHSFFIHCDSLQNISGFNESLSQHQIFDAMLRLSETIDSNQIYHIPQVLFHYPVDLLNYNNHSETYQEVLEEHLNRIGQGEAVLTDLNGSAWQIRYTLPEQKPLVSIIIPTRNGLQVLQQCIESIVNHTQYTNYEIIVVDNQSDDSHTLNYFAQIKEKYSVKVIAYDAPFNYSAINNFAADRAAGEFLAFLNNDVEVISPDWLDEMVSLAAMPKHGAVGCMLYYPNDTIQHAGVIGGIGDVAGHAWIDKKRGFKDHLDRNLVSRHMTISTAACIVMRQEIFACVGGFNEEQLAVAYNDVDLCLKIHAKGYHNVWTPFAELYHHESVSRGADDTPEKQQRYFKEVRYMWKHWHDLLMNDPAYNRNLSLRRGYYEPAVVSRVNKPWLNLKPEKNRMIPPEC